MTTAEELRDKALEQVEENANAEWTQLVLETIHNLAQGYFVITSDDVWLELEKYPHIKTHQPSAMGAMFRRAASLGYITPTDRFVTSKRPSSHARPIRVWDSKL